MKGYNMIGKWARLIMKYQLFEKRSQGRTIKRLASLTVTGTGHEVNIKNRCELDAVKLKVLNRGEILKRRVEHNLLMLTLLSRYILHSMRVGRVGVWACGRRAF
jgi:hypothetical protein